LRYGKLLSINGYQRHHCGIILCPAKYPPSEAKVDNYAARMTINQVRVIRAEILGATKMLPKCCQRH